MRWRTSDTTSGQRTCNPIASNGRIQTDSAVHQTPWTTPAMTAALACSATALGVTGAIGTRRASQATMGVTAAHQYQTSSVYATMRGAECPCVRTSQYTANEKRRPNAVQPRKMPIGTVRTRNGVGAARLSACAGARTAEASSAGTTGV